MIGFIIFAALLSIPTIIDVHHAGIAVVLLNDKESVNPRYIASKLAALKPEVFQATPSMYKCILPYLDNDTLFNKTIVGGEELSFDLSTELFRKSKWLCNVYGPTETTVWSSLNIISEAGDTSIGKPIYNTGIYILNENNDVVENCTVGRICISGKGLAIGYHNNNALYNKKFIDVTHELNFRVSMT